MDGQRDTMNNTLRYIHQRNTVHIKTLQLHKRKNRISNRMTYLLLHWRFANTKPDITHPIRYNFTRCGCSLK